MPFKTHTFCLSKCREHVFLFPQALTLYHIVLTFIDPNIEAFSGSKKFQNSYWSSCHFALVLQLDKEG